MDDLRRNYYDITSRLPRTRCIPAESLLAAADVLWSKISELEQSLDGTSGPDGWGIVAELEALEGPYFLLAGFALENVLKGLILAASGDPHDRALTCHDLVQLAERVGEGLAPGERELLERVTAYTRWAGRYALPRDERELAIVDFPMGDEGPPAIARGGDEEALRPLTERLLVRLRAVRSSDFV